MLALAGCEWRNFSELIFDVDPPPYCLTSQIAFRSSQNLSHTLHHTHHESGERHWVATCQFCTLTSIFCNYSRFKNEQSPKKSTRNVLARGGVRFRFQIRSNSIFNFETRFHSFKIRFSTSKFDFVHSKLVFAKFVVGGWGRQNVKRGFS